MAKGKLRTVSLPSGDSLPVLGQGTWRMGENKRRRREEVEALRYGLDLGLALIDTAEMYGDGGAEEIVAEAIAGRRDEVFLVSKVLPQHASTRGTIEACERSLKRLKTDRIDLYLLHWRGEYALDETVAGFSKLKEKGMIRHWGVSNFDASDMDELEGIHDGKSVACNQVLYNLKHRGIEHDLLLLCRAQEIAIMAYSPIEQGLLANSKVLKAVAERHEATPAQIALAWTIRQDGVVAIPKAVSKQHLNENRAAHDVRLTKDDLADLDRAFPPPKKKKTPLETI